MTNKQNNKTTKTDDNADPVLTPEELNNKRIAVRYIRADITASLKLLGFFNFTKLYSAEILDISSKGAAIKCSKSMSIHKKITLTLSFEDKTVFKIPARIIYKKEKEQQYGVKFDQFNNKLGDYLVLSGQDLVFK